MKVIEMEFQNWEIEFSWIKAHIENHGNELTNQIAEEATSATKGFRKVQC